MQPAFASALQLKSLGLDCHKRFFAVFSGMSSILSRSDTVRVAVDFSPRRRDDNRLRRGATVESLSVKNGSKRRYATRPCIQCFTRGMNPTATIRTSLREQCLVAFELH